MVDGQYGNRECVMSDYIRRGKKWKVFFTNFSKEEQTLFLFSQLADTSETKIHTCPCFVATNGEVAVYALQKIFNKNWYELSNFEGYALKDGTDCSNNEQAWLRQILEDEKGRLQLKQAWEYEAN